MAKNDTAYTPITKPETSFNGVSKTDNTYAATTKSESGYVNTFSEGINYDEATVTYNMAIINYNGQNKMTKFKDAYTEVSKAETVYS